MARRGHRVIDTGFDMPTGIDQKEELVRALRRLGIGPLELIASIRDEIVVLDRERRVVAFAGDAPDESPRRADELLGETLRETFCVPAACVHRTAHLRGPQG